MIDSRRDDRQRGDAAVLIVRHVVRFGLAGAIFGDGVRQPAPESGEEEQCDDDADEW